MPKPKAAQRPADGSEDQYRIVCLEDGFDDACAPQEERGRASALDLYRAHGAKGHKQRFEHRERGAGWVPEAGRERYTVDMLVSKGLAKVMPDGRVSISQEGQSILDSQWRHDEEQAG